jgi:hypothetical protein
MVETVRAVAKTRSPWDWKTLAREDPMPPSLHPVMRTLFWCDMVVVVVVAVKEETLQV